MERISDLNCSQILGELKLPFLISVLKDREFQLDNSMKRWQQGRLWDTLSNPFNNFSEKEILYAAKSMRALFDEGVAFVATDGHLQNKCFNCIPPKKMVADISRIAAACLNLGPLLKLQDSDFSRREFLKILGIGGAALGTSLISSYAFLSLTERDLAAKVPQEFYPLIQELIQAQIDFEKQRISQIDDQELKPVFSEVEVLWRNQVMALNSWHHLATQNFDQDKHKLLLMAGIAHVDIEQQLKLGFTTLQSRLTQLAEGVISAITADIDDYSQSRMTHLANEILDWSVLFAEPLVFSRKVQHELVTNTNRKVATAKAIFTEVVLRKLKSSCLEPNSKQNSFKMMVMARVVMNLATSMINDRFSVFQINNSSAELHMVQADLNYKNFVPINLSLFNNKNVNFSLTQEINLKQAFPIGLIKDQHQYHPVVRSFEFAGEEAIVAQDFVVLPTGAVMKLNKTFRYRLACLKPFQWMLPVNNLVKLYDLGPLYEKKTRVEFKIAPTTIVSGGTRHDANCYAAQDKSQDPMQLDAITISSSRF